jgi:hypothetical protein
VVIQKETGDLFRLARNQRVWVYVIMKIMGVVGRVEVCMLCTGVSEDHGNGEGVVFQDCCCLSSTTITDLEQTLKCLQNE